MFDPLILAFIAVGFGAQIIDGVLGMGYGVVSTTFLLGGPIVTSTIVARGHEPRLTIGSVNAAEFFVTVAQCITFFLGIQILHWKIILGLIAGGVCAAPLAAYFCGKLPARTLMSAVGVLIILLSLRTIYLAHTEIPLLARL
jgi:uncharacterized membrane protein YfcA